MLEIDTMHAQSRRPLMIALLLSAFLGLAHAGPFDTWQYRMQITFAGYDKPGTLTNFPALVELSTNDISGFGYDQFASATAEDLRFAASNRADELSYEIEKWDTNGTSYVWVRVPRITGTGDYIYAYWGKSGATTPPCATNGSTWESTYAAVWHMDETNVKGSTTNANNGTAYGGVTLNSGGRIGDSLSFNGVNNTYVRVPASGLTRDPLTVTWWMNQVTADGEVVFMNRSTYNGADGVEIWPGAASQMYARGAGITRAESTSTTYQGQWVQVGVAMDGTTASFYRNGVYDGSGSIGTVVSSSHDMYIGSYAGGTYPFGGDLDEIRFSHCVRSSNWVWACWANQASNQTLVDYGAAAPQSSELAVYALTAADIGSTSAVFRGQLGQIGGAENPEAYFVWSSSDQGTNGGTSAWATVVSLGSTWGAGQSFSNTLTGLLPGSNHAYRCYATNSTGEAWSDDVITFTTIGLPTVTNHGAACSQTNAVLLGEVLDTGGEIPGIWVYHWPDGGSTSVVAKGVQDGTFWVNWTGLTASSTYHYTILASNRAGTVWTSTHSFTTKAPGASQTWYVSLSGDHSLGLSWETGFTNIQAGIDAATAGDTVLVSDGPYYTTAELVVAKGITIRSDNGANATTVARATGAGSFRVFTLNHADAVLDGVTVTNGSLGSGGQGAGVRIVNGTLRNSIVAHNKTWGNYNGSSYGSGVYMTGGTVEDCTISNNWTGASSGYGGVGHGGGVYMTGGTVRRCRILNNSSKSSYSYANGRGGGVYMTAGQLENSLILNNEGPGYGGGVVLAGANARLLHCTVSDNTSYRFRGGAPHDRGCGLQLHRLFQHANVRPGAREREQDRRHNGLLLHDTA